MRTTETNRGESTRDRSWVDKRYVLVYIRQLEAGPEPVSAGSWIDLKYNRWSNATTLWNDWSGRVQYVRRRDLKSGHCEYVKQVLCSVGTFEVHISSGSEIGKQNVWNVIWERFTEIVLRWWQSYGRWRGWGNGIHIPRWGSVSASDSLELPCTDLHRKWSRSACYGKSEYNFDLQT